MQRLQESLLLFGYCHNKRRPVTIARKPSFRDDIRSRNSRGTGKMGIFKLYQTPASWENPLEYFEGTSPSGAFYHLSLARCSRIMTTQASGAPHIDFRQRNKGPHQDHRILGIQIGLRIWFDSTIPRCTPCAAAPFLGLERMHHLSTKALRPRSSRGLSRQWVGGWVPA